MRYLDNSIFVWPGSVLMQDQVVLTVCHITSSQLWVTMVFFSQRTYWLVIAGTERVLLLTWTMVLLYWLGRHPETTAAELSSNTIRFIIYTCALLPLCHVSKLSSNTAHSELFKHDLTYCKRIIKGGLIRRCSKCKPVATAFVFFF